MTSTTSAPTISPEETELNTASDTVHEESKYADECSRTHGQPRSQRDPTMFKNTDQDNLVDISTNKTNIGIYSGIFLHGYIHFQFERVLLRTDFIVQVHRSNALLCFFVHRNF